MCVELSSHANVHLIPRRTDPQKKSRPRTRNPGVKLRGHTHIEGRKTVTVTVAVTATVTVTVRVTVTVIVIVMVIVIVIKVLMIKNSNKKGNRDSNNSVNPNAHI